MAGPVEFNTLLVPIDLSENSQSALRQAIGLVAGDDPVVIVLHVIDPALPKFAEAHDLGSHEEIVRRMRERAEAQMQEHVGSCPDDIEVDSIISEGLPFLEILQKADDFAVDAIVMGKVGKRGQVEDLLFGSTAEKVLRGANKPVLVLPPGD